MIYISALSFGIGALQSLDISTFWNSWWGIYSFFEYSDYMVRIQWPG